jgi:hypothetical protein
MKHARIAALFLLGTAPLSVGVAFTLKSLIMPGRVIEAHADIEDDCDSCHERTEGENQSDLCFVCHTPIRDDVASRTGFHGRNPEASTAACYTCHAEHEGRDADVVGLDVATFAHAHTDLELEGAHAELMCTDCHTSDAEYRDAPNQCVGCHKSEDVHMGTLGTECTTCHSPTAWVRTKFDHSRTRFALTGAHSEATCAACHQDQTFVGAERECVGCHLSEDVHEGRNGAQCGTCHSATAWLVPSFDHAAKTGFALRGSHANLACESCHVTNLAAALPSTCNGCHRTDDPHEGRLGESCSSCHDSNQWAATRFDHTAITDFVLRGAHVDVQCTTCHADGVDAPLGHECTSCHAEDPHQTQLGSRFESCHSETAWHSPVRFDHGLIAFPLLGRHATLECSACHASAAFHDAGAACVDCHAAADPHGGNFGAECATCHNPTDWHAWIFDHAATAFPLTGAHARSACASCHQQAATEMSAAPRECGQCHRRDDPHAGGFGNDCASCHTTESFEELGRAR